MMSKAAGIAGWAVAVALLAAMAFLARVNQDLNARLTASNEERADQSELSAELSEIVSELSRGLERTQARVEEIEKATAELLDRRRSGFSSFEDLGDGVGNALGDLGAIIDLIRGGQALVSGNPLAILTERLLPQDAPEAVARTTVDLRYGDFIRSLGLDETRQSEVEEAFVRGVTAQVERARSNLLGGDAADEPGEDVDVLRDHLVDVLTPEELERFDASRSDALERNIRRNFNVQLELFARRLSPENRELVLNVLVEETLKVMEEEGIASSGGLGFGEQLDTQTTVYPRALERLREDLDDEQFAVVEGFVDNQLNLIETSTRLFQSFRDRVSGEPEAQ